MKTSQLLTKIFNLFRILAILALIFSQLGWMVSRAVASKVYCKVDADAPGANTGASWANAYTSLQSALGISTCAEVWVAAGAYKPTTTTDRTATFQLKDQVSIYGGFAGTETQLEQRNPAANPTILSGDLNGDDVGFTNNSENAYHVVTGANGAILDGFTIQGGNANGNEADNYDRGGGVYNSSSSPTLENIIFSDNYAVRGGAMYNGSTSSPVLTNITFNGNTAGFGAGMRNENSSSPALTNITFSDNSASSSGGGMLNSSSSPTLNNVTFNGNSAAYNGGGIYNSSDSNPTIQNTILWGNTAPSGGTQIYNSSSVPSLYDSVVQDGCPEGSSCPYGVWTTDPLLGTLGNYGGFTPTIPIQKGSSAIDHGNNTTCAVTDQRGVARPNGQYCDIGAYEFVRICYVDVDASGSQDGTSWVNAFKVLNSALGLSPCKEIWVADGTYKPTTGTDRSATFTLKDGVGIYGGFAGTETSREQRDPASNLTILSGDLNGDDDGFTNNSENTYHVVTGAVGGILDGFTIRGGNASSGDGFGGGLFNNSGSLTLANITFASNSALYAGGGMANISSSPYLTNVTFNGNKSSSSGGGMYNNSSSPTLTNVTFSANSSVNNGGGMYNFTNSSPSLTNVTFSGNTVSTGDGGGMYNESNSAPTLTNVTFSSNSANDEGGGMYDTGSSPSLTNVTFNGNSADVGGGMYNTGSSPSLTNVTFSGNSADIFVGGLYNISASNPVIQDSIFWGNGSDGISNPLSAPIIYDSLIEGGCPTNATCSNILSINPNLVALANNGGFTQTMALGSGSTAIDAGNDLTCASFDQRGVGRPQGAHCDMGAYETQVILYATPGGLTSGICASWAQSCKLHHALAISTSGQEIWATDGIYKPNPAAGRSATFQLKNGVAIYGGFAGVEIARTERNVEVNLTLLSGDLNGDDVGFTNNAENVYHVVTGATGATLDGLAIQGGNANGNEGAYYDRGGGMYNLSSSPTLTNVTIRDNYATRGGGMYNTVSSPDLTYVTISGNTAGFGGGMYNLSSSNPTLQYVTFSGNSAGNGAGMLNSSSSPTLDDVTFDGNSATYSGGGIYNSSSSSPILTIVVFAGNSAPNSGGGIYNSSSSPSLTFVTFDTNTSISGDGGGMYNTGGSPGLTSVIFNGNSAGNYGGGFTNSGATANPTMTDIIFSNNSAGIGGGGMMNSGGSPIMTDITFNANTASYSGTGSGGLGGGMYNHSGIPTLTNTTFVNNHAGLTGSGIGGHGGGMYANDHPTLTNVTFSGNSADGSGGGFINAGTSVLNNAIFWGNTSVDQGEQVFCPLTCTLNYSVVQGGCPAGCSCPNVLISTDPKLGSPGSYGGYTPTVPLLAGSSAIDSGNPAVPGSGGTACASADQRGISRPQGLQCDIGAYEAQLYNIPLVTGWNLVSFNLHPVNTAIADVLASLGANFDLVYAWDATGGHAGAGNWMRYAPGIPGNTLETLDETQGFWIRMTSGDSLEISGTTPITSNISLSIAAGGWNLVGYPSLVIRPMPEAITSYGISDYSLVYGYHANDADTWKRYAPGVPGNDLLELAPGWGYWIKVGANGTWHVEY